jgi:hypothetical protein
MMCEMECMTEIEVQGRHVSHKYGGRALDAIDCRCWLVTRTPARMSDARLLIARNNGNLLSVFCHPHYG